MEIKTDEAMFSVGQLSLIHDMAKFVLDVKDLKVQGVTVKVNANEIEDLRDIVNRTSGRMR